MDTPVRIFIVTMAIVFGVFFWTNTATCVNCPGMACQSNAECGTCSCAKRAGQPWGSCYWVATSDVK